MKSRTHSSALAGPALVARRSAGGISAKTYTSDAANQPGAPAVTRAHSRAVAFALASRAEGSPRLHQLTVCRTLQVAVNSQTSSDRLAHPTTGDRSKVTRLSGVSTGAARLGGSHLPSSPRSPRRGIPPARTPRELRYRGGRELLKALGCVSGQERERPPSRSIRQAWKVCVVRHSHAHAPRAARLCFLFREAEPAEGPWTCDDSHPPERKRTPSRPAGKRTTSPDRVSRKPALRVRGGCPRHAPSRHRTASPSSPGRTAGSARRRSRRPLSV